LRSAGARSPRARRPLQAPGGVADPPRIELQRARKLVTAAEAVRKFPFEGLLSAGANGHASVSRDTFEEHVEGVEAAQLAAFEQVLALAGERGLPGRGGLAGSCEGGSLGAA
jgi:hypothetical protein